MEQITSHNNAEIVQIKIKHVKQLFNSLDPSPFIEKDLDDDAEEYIFSSFNEYPLKKRVKIQIKLPGQQKGKFNEDEIKDAVRNFFAYRTMISENNIGFKIEEGRKSLIIGILFLVFCLGVGEGLQILNRGVMTRIFAEAMTILGWVAMWKPISNILYDWWPLKNQKRIYEKISGSEIEFSYE